MKKRVAEESKKENFPRSRLPTFTPEEVKYIRGTCDFLGLNHYTTMLVAGDKPNITGDIPSLLNDIGVTTYYDPSWPTSKASWLKEVPWGFRKLLVWIKKEYGNPEVYITENGFPDTGELNDTKRIHYMKVSDVNNRYNDSI